MFNIFNKEITEKNLKKSGWRYMYKCPFTGKPKWYRGMHTSPILDFTTETFSYNPETCQVTYHGGEFSTVTRTVSNMKELNRFFDVLNDHPQQ